MESQISGTTAKFGSDIWLKQFLLATLRDARAATDDVHLSTADSVDPNKVDFTAL